MLGAEGATDEFILEKQIEIKRTSNSLFLGGYNWEDESVLFFIRGMAERNFKNEFLKLFFFLQGPENLGVLYRIDPIRIKYRLLFYLYSNLNQDKEKKKGLIVREIILNNLEKSKFDEDPEEITRRYLDMCYSENRLLEAANEKIISGLKKPKIYWDSDYHLAKIFDDKIIVFVLQNGLKTYIKKKYNIDLFRCPDEAYIIEYNTGKKIIKILEKKEQNVEGSVETKLWSGPSLKREYELVLGDEFEVHYGFCVSQFLKDKLISNQKKYVILNTIFKESNITVLFGDDENYFETFDNWFNSS